MVPHLDGKSLSETVRTLESQFWTQDRLSSNATAVKSTTLTGSFVERVRKVVGKQVKDMSTSTPMTFVDLLAAYYVRRLQIDVVPHVCMIGYCRKSWNDKCKYNLPETEVVETLSQNDELVRMRPRKTHLRDDAWNKVTQLDVLAETGLNLQINQHHPHGAHKGMLYPVKYRIGKQQTNHKLCSLMALVVTTKYC